LMDQFRTIVSDIDSIVLSDYGKGLLSQDLTRELIKTADRNNVPVVVDPKGSNYSKYSGASTITPNTSEAEQAAELEIDSNSSLQRAGEKLLKQYSFDSLLITRGSEGMALFESPGVSFTNLEAQAREVYDVTGAGDTVVSLMGLGLAGSNEFYQSAQLANKGAGIVVGKVGTATVTRDEILEYLQSSITQE
ncbi:MAG: bifunctional heptose 7-phosphate kinase/heptose 1-phosphate adenyltransferase, partial [bacterium]